MKNIKTLYIPQKLQITRGAYVSYCRQLLGKLGLTEQQWRVLEILGVHGTVDTGVIAKHCNFFSPSLTGILKRMESSGLVYRHRDDFDQRRVKVSITESGREILAKVSPALDVYHEKIEFFFTKHKAQQLITLLDQLEKLTEQISRDISCKIL